MVSADVTELYLCEEVEELLFTIQLFIWGSFAERKIIVSTFLCALIRPLNNSIQ